MSPIRAVNVLGQFGHGMTTVGGFWSVRDFLATLRCWASAILLFSQDDALFLTVERHVDLFCASSSHVSWSISNAFSEVFNESL